MIVALRWVLVPGWILGAVAATMFLPSFSSASAGGAAGILPRSSAAITTQANAVKDFGFPLLSQTAVVQYNANGLSPAAKSRVITRAARIDAHGLPGASSIAGAIPIINAAGTFPSSRGDGTTAITYLLFDPSVSTGAQQAAVKALVSRYISSPGDSYQGTTGAYPAQDSEAAAVSSALKVIELAAVGVVFLVVAVSFRSLGAPVIALVTVGVAYFTAVRVLAAAANAFGFALPGELEPLIVILVVGIVTDYSIFFLAAHRDEYAAGAGPVGSARQSATAVVPIVAVAGTTVAAGTATLLIARLSLYGELGPGMAISAVVAFVVAVTFLPAAMALSGRALFWPFDHPTRRYRAEMAKHESGLRTRVTRFSVRRPVAAVMLTIGVGALVVGLSPLGSLKLGLNIVSDLGAGTSPARASAAAAHGFAPGIVAPTEIVLSAPDIGAQRAALSALERDLAAQPGVAGALGPADQPTRSHFGLFIDPAGNAARYLVILSGDPYGASGIAAFQHLRAELPSLLARSALRRAHTGLAGDTALAATLSTETRSAVVRVGAAILAVDLVMLILFLRALVAPVFLLGASLLSVLAAMGITTKVFQNLGDNSLTFFVPVAVGVLLVSFGSDYNIFLVGRVWEATHTRTLRQAIISAVPRASSTITRAGIALTATFALLAIIPPQVVPGVRVLHGRGHPPRHLRRPFLSRPGHPGPHRQMVRVAEPDTHGQTDPSQRRNICHGPHRRVTERAKGARPGPATDRR